MSPRNHLLSATSAPGIQEASFSKEIRHEQSNTLCLAGIFDRSRSSSLECTYAGMKDFKAAVEPLLRTLTYQPNNPEALTNLGYAYTQQSHYREALVLVHQSGHA